MKPRLLPALALAAALATAGCQNPDGTTDWGSTLALGAGVALVAGLAAASASDGGHHRQPPRRGAGSYGGSGRSYAGGYGRNWR
ncbi:hypothetical protein [Roseomonas indoligenes]|uniref:Lipoprotein n=1 Tax=Roseomonas indoligenes TaxID=2820811 RepID=A0A940N230_9PROT|nr:hypothetical protein [Pararoseomonas indoligenes]MBP0492802.1 hypothetical protein [Pararoseomonas indoligenes]